MPRPRLRALPPVLPVMLPVMLLAGAALAGAALSVLAVDTPLTGPLTLLFLLLGPALATWPLLPRLTRPARAIVAGTMTFVVNGTVAQLMVSLDLWSPRRGVAAVLVCCALLAAVDLLLANRRPAGGGPEESRHEDEEWLFEG